MATVKVQISDIKGKPGLMVEYDDPETGAKTLRGVGVGGSLLGWSHEKLKELGCGLHEIEPVPEPEVIPRKPLPRDPADPDYKPPRVADVMDSLCKPAVLGQIAITTGMSMEEAQFATEVILSLTKPPAKSPE